MGELVHFQLQLEAGGKRVFKLVFPFDTQNTEEHFYPQVTEGRPQTNWKKSVVLGMRKLRSCKEPGITCPLYYKVMEQNLEKPENISRFINQPSWRETQMASTWNQLQLEQESSLEDQTQGPRLQAAP